MPHPFDFGGYISGKQSMRRVIFLLLPLVASLSVLHYAIEFWFFSPDGEDWEPLRRWLALNLVLSACMLWIIWAHSHTLNNGIAFMVRALLVFGLVVWALSLQFFWGWRLIGFSM